MSYDKDWEVHLALNNPHDPIHGYIEEQLKKDEENEKKEKSEPKASQQKHG